MSQFKIAVIGSVSASQLELIKNQVSQHGLDLEIISQEIVDDIQVVETVPVTEVPVVEGSIYDSEAENNFAEDEDDDFEDEDDFDEEDEDSTLITDEIFEEIAEEMGMSLSQVKEKAEEFGVTTIQEALELDLPYEVTQILEEALDA